MALFKIEKGTASNLATNRPKAVEGYCYFTVDDGKFYIDVDTADIAITPSATVKLEDANRIPLNAYRADYAVRALSDMDGNQIDTTYLKISDASSILGETGATAGSYGPSADVTGTNNTTISVPYITVDKYGRVTSIENKTYTSKDTTYSTRPNPYALTIGTKSYTGSAAVTITTEDLGLSRAMRFIGVTDSITNGNTGTPTIINGQTNYTADSRMVGDVVLNSINGYGYLWTGNEWEVLGSGASDGGTADQTTGSLIFGSADDPLFTFNGSEDVIIPIYNGGYELIGTMTPFAGGMSDGYIN